MRSSAERRLSGFLAGQGLVAQPQHPRAPAASRNLTFVCRARRGWAFVKLSSSTQDYGVIREGRVLAALAPLSARGMLGPPRVLAVDARRGALALEWLGRSQSLFEVVHRPGGRSPELGARLGRGLGRLHRRSQAHRARFARFDSDANGLLESFLRMPPDFFARLSPAGVELFAGVQADAEAVEVLQALSTQQPGDEACLVHGDLRLANVLRAGPRLVLVDWELAGWGDPARDLGTLVGDCALGWMGPDGGAPWLSRRALARFLGPLVEGYREGRFGPGPLPGGFAERVTRWAAVGLLSHVVAAVHYEESFARRERSLVEYALAMLVDPRPWARALWGAR